MQMLEKYSTSAHDTLTYGPGWREAFERVHGLSDEEKISDPQELRQMYLNGKLTWPGLGAALAELRKPNSPEDEASRAVKAQAFKAWHGVISRADDGLGITDPEGETRYRRFMEMALPLYNRLQKQGESQVSIHKTIDEIAKSPEFHPNHTDELASKLKDKSDIPSTSAGSFDRMPLFTYPDTLPYAPDETVPLPKPRPATTTNPSGKTVWDTDTPDGLRAAVLSGQISRTDGERIAVERGYIRPSVAVPISR
jgi:hypothetical protein